MRASAYGSAFLAPILLVLAFPTTVLAQGACSWDPSIGQPGMSADVWSLLSFDDGTGEALYAGGAFATAGGETVNRIARWDGQVWAPLGDGVGGVSSPVVYALAEFDDGTGAALYVGGAFTTAGGETAQRIARWDGEAWSPLGEGLGNNVRALAVFDDGEGEALYAGGTFQTAGGQDIVGVARWDGEEWSALGKGLGGGLPFVYAMTVFDDGDGPALYVGGTFITAGGESATNIARWDGEDWSSVGGGVDGWVTAFTVFDGGEGTALYVGGAFNNAGGTQARRVARWDGDNWSALGAGVTGDFPWVEALAGFDDGTGPALYVGGWFEIAGEQPASRIARWDGENWSNLGFGVNERLWTILPYDAGDGEALYVGGHFTASGGAVSNRITRWTCEPPVTTEPIASGPDLRLSSYPNPSSGNMTITLELGEAGPAQLAVYDLLGRQMLVIVEGDMAAGRHSIDWSARQFATGVYVIRLTTLHGSLSRRIVVAN